MNSALTGSQGRGAVNLAGGVVIGEEIDPSIEHPAGTETTALPPPPAREDSPKSFFPFLSGKNLLLLIFFWPWLFIPICFALFYGYHSKYYYDLEGSNQVPTISVSGSLSPSSILFAYGLHLEAVFIGIFFIVLYHLYTEKIDSYYNTDRMLDDDYSSHSQDLENGSTAPPPQQQLSAPQQHTVITTEPPSLHTPIMRNIDENPLNSNSNNNSNNNNSVAITPPQQLRHEQCQGWYRYWINTCECCTCYGCRFFQCACCYCDYLAFDDHFTHTNPERYPLLRKYLHHWNRVCLIIGLIAAWCMSMVGSIDLGVNAPVHGFFAFFMFTGGIMHEVFFFYHVTRHVGSVQRHSLFPIFCHQVCLVITLPFNIFAIIVTGIIYLACGRECDVFVFNMFPALEFTTILFVLLYVLSFYDEFARIQLVTTVNHDWKNN